MEIKVSIEDREVRAELEALQRRTSDLSPAIRSSPKPFTHPSGGTSRSADGPSVGSLRFVSRGKADRR